jgi:hypothetical protein
MKPKRLTDRTMRMIARRERDGQWEFMERVAREGIVWMCPWDKYGRHKNGDGVYVFGLIGSNEFYHWLGSHKDWWIRGRWSEKRCARSIRITQAGRKALKNREKYDMEPIFGGMVEPGYVVTPWPRKKTVSDVREIRGLVAEANKYA